MADKTITSAPQTQTQRRIKYGLNVAVAGLAAVALVILLNVIVYRSFYRLAPAARDWLRFDLTATRQYSLSEQTRRVVEQLDDDYRIVTLFRVTGEELARVNDLVDEYGRFSDRVRVEHIDPDVNYAQREKFYGELRERFAKELEPVASAINQGQEAMTAVLTEMGSMAEPLGAAIDNPELNDAQLKEFLTSVRAAIPRTQQQIEKRQEEMNRLLEDQPLPDYGSVQSELSSLFTQLDGNVLAVATERFNQVGGNANVPSRVKDTLLGLSKTMTGLRDRLRTALEALRLAQVPERYTELTTALATTEPIVVVGPTQVRVLNVADMFRAPDQQTAQETGDTEVRFVGEERLTGALVSLSVEKPALVVFVLTSPQPAIGPRGSYEGVAQRLRAANFRVEQWNPMGQFSMMGGQTPPEPAPEPEEGQKRIWIVLPFPPTNPMNPMAGGAAKPQVAQLLEEGLANGDAALVMPTYDPASQFGGGDDAIAGLLTKWGLTPQTDRVVLQEVQLPDRQREATTQFRLDTWPDEMAITKALGGMRGVVVQACPIVIGQAEGAKTAPLVRVTGERLWAESDMAELQSRAAKYDETNAAESFVVGAASERGDGRLIAVADPVWASNEVTTLGPLGPGSAEMLGALFPANSELFVNSVYWLAGLDQLIAASPRSQDIRRVENVSPEALTGYRMALLVGLPVVIIACGMGMWFVRRRG